MSDKEDSPKRVIGITGPVIEKYFSNKNPMGEPQSVEDLIQRNKTLAQQKIDSGDPRWEWEFVTIMADRALKALEDGDVFYLCYEIYGIGRYVEKLLLLDPHHQREIAKILKTSQSQEAPFQTRIYKREEVKARARREARQIWQADAEDELLIGEVAELLVEELEAKLGKELKDFIPKKETMRKWIRPVAPVYATKHGRPRKLKK